MFLEKSIYYEPRFKFSIYHIFEQYLSQFYKVAIKIAISSTLSLHRNQMNGKIGQYYNLDRESPGCEYKIPHLSRYKPLYGRGHFGRMTDTDMGCIFIYAEKLKYVSFGWMDGKIFKRMCYACGPQ